MNNQSNEAVKEQLLSDNMFLQGVIYQVNSLMKILPKQLFSIKDLDATTIYMSEGLANFLQIEVSSIIGKVTLFSLYEDPDIEQKIKEEDKKIINSRMAGTILKVNKINGSLKAYLCIKAPIINPETNHVVGLLVQVIESGIVNFMDNLLLENIECNSSDVVPSLSKRERQVIFFFMAHFSSEEIVQALLKVSGKKITKNAVDNIFKDQIFPKFDVYSRVALYKKLKMFGFNHKVPQEILTGSSQLLTAVESY